MSLPTLTWDWGGRITIGPGGAIETRRQAKAFIELIEELAKRLPEGGQVAAIQPVIKGGGLTKEA